MRPSITMLGVDNFFLWGTLIVFMKYFEMLGALHKVCLGLISNFVWGRSSDVDALGCRFKVSILLGGVHLDGFLDICSNQIEEYIFLPDAPSWKISVSHIPAHPRRENCEDSEYLDKIGEIYGGLVKFVFINLRVLV